MTLDHESRANRFLSSMAAVQHLLANAVPGFNVAAEDLAQLLATLNDEARRVVVPFRGSANDDDEEDSG